MSIKIRSFGGPIVWLFRKYNSELTSKIALSFAAFCYKRHIKAYIDYYERQDEKPFFQNCMIETINRCNGTCEFCPANKKDESRPFKKMTEKMYYGIIQQLREINWHGKLYLNINNEPFIDVRLIKFAKYAKEQIPEIQTAVITNGTLLSLEKLDEMPGAIDEIVINDYGDKYILSKQHKNIYKYVKKNPKRFSNMSITINRRYGKEILATRAGNAPNKPKKNSTIDSPCIYPFLDFLIYPDGQVGMCCNDCKEISGFGNITKNSLLEIWHNKKFENLRSIMKSGRSSYSFCRDCDVVDVGEREAFIKEFLKNRSI